MRATPTSVLVVILSGLSTCATPGCRSHPTREQLADPPLPLQQTGTNAPATGATKVTIPDPHPIMTYTSPPSSIARQIMLDWTRLTNGLRFSCLRTDPAGGTSSVERVVIWPLPGMSDGYTYHVTIDHTARVYHVTRSGGIAGTIDHYGPLPFPDIPSTNATAGP